jgi:hypothetical protein
MLPQHEGMKRDPKIVNFFVRINRGSFFLFKISNYAAAVK